MADSLENRLRSWREVLERGGPWWMVEMAPRIVRELEAELAERQARAK